MRSLSPQRYREPKKSIPMTYLLHFGTNFHRHFCCVSSLIAITFTPLPIQVFLYPTFHPTTAVTTLPPSGSISRGLALTTQSHPSLHYSQLPRIHLHKHQTVPRSATSPIGLPDQSRLSGKRFRRVSITPYSRSFVAEEFGITPYSASHYPIAYQIQFAITLSCQSNFLVNAT